MLAQEAYENVWASKQFIDDPDWSDTLGHKEDIVEAEKILNRSLTLAASAIDQRDVKQALE